MKARWIRWRAQYMIVLAIALSTGRGAMADPPVLTSISLTPSNANLVVGQNQGFMATGTDQWGNPYPLTLAQPVWLATGGGELVPSGETCLYRSLTSGDHIIYCRPKQGSVVGSAAIRTTPEPRVLTSIVVAPTNVNLLVGQIQLFTATGKDQYGKDFPIAYPEWSCSGGGTLSVDGSSCTYTATTTGDYSVTCRQKGTGIQGAAALHTETAVLTDIVTTPTSDNLLVGQVQSFTATGKDQFNNDHPISNPAWFTTGGGTLEPSGATCAYTATATGENTVECWESGTEIKGTSQVRGSDLPPVLQNIVVTPTSVNLLVGQVRSFTATGKDQYDGDYPISNPVWSTTGGGTLEPSGATCTYTTTATGENIIECREAGTEIKGTSRIRVPPVLSNILLTPTSVNLLVGQVQSFTATGKDQLNNDYPITDATWACTAGARIQPNGNSCALVPTTIGQPLIQVLVDQGVPPSVGTILVERPRIQSVSPNPPAVTFHGYTTSVYSLQYRDDLQAGTWSNVPGVEPVLGTNGPLALSDTNRPAARSRLYRMMMEVLGP